MMPRPVEPNNQQYYLDLFDRLLPDFYLEPLKSGGAGYEYFQAVAALAARVSEAIAHIENGCYILTAGIGSYSEAEVAFTRTSNSAGATVVQAGTVVATEDGYAYRTLADADLGFGYGPVQVPVRAVTRGWLYNQPGPEVTAAGKTIAGPISIISSPLIAAPVYFDPALVVTQITPATGGSSPMLQGLGLDRGIAINTGESPDAYRERLRRLPDTVTPSAMQRLIDYLIKDAVAAVGKSYEMREWWDLRLMTCYDFPLDTGPLPVPGSATETFDATGVFVYDHTPADPLANRWPLPPGSFLIALPQIAGLEALYAGLAENITQSRPAGIVVAYILTT